MMPNRGKLTFSLRKAKVYTLGNHCFGGGSNVVKEICFCLWYNCCKPIPCKLCHQKDKVRFRILVLCVVFTRHGQQVSVLPVFHLLIIDPSS